MDHRPQPRIYDAYLVRLWRDSHESPWRASAQSVLDSQTIHFSNLQALFAFLELHSSQADDAQTVDNGG